MPNYAVSNKPCKVENYLFQNLNSFLKRNSVTNPGFFQEIPLQTRIE